jgi:hypothetical protein
MRLRATVGEISDALEKIYGRHRADIQKVTGVYAAAGAAHLARTIPPPVRRAGLHVAGR